MKIYCLGLSEEFGQSDFSKSPKPAWAQFSAVGTWNAERRLCEVCGWPWEELVPPLLIQWESSTETIGNFSWDGPFGYQCVVTEDTSESLARMIDGIEYADVVVLEPDRKRRVVPFPYTGPRLLWLRTQTCVELDREASEVEKTVDCSICGHEEFTFKYESIVIRKSDWNGEHIFRIKTNGNSAATFITEELKNQIESVGFANFQCRVAGEISR